MNIQPADHYSHSHAIVQASIHTTKQRKQQEIRRMLSTKWDWTEARSQTVTVRLLLLLHLFRGLFQDNLGKPAPER